VVTFIIFLEDVFPQQRGGFQVLKTPQVLKWLFDPSAPVDPNYQPLPEDQRPGGYNFGGGNVDDLPNEPADNENN